MTRLPSEWINIADMLTPEGMASLDESQVLTFRDGSFRIVKLTKKRCWVVPTRLYTPEEADAEVSVVDVPEKEPRQA